MGISQSKQEQNKREWNQQFIDYDIRVNKVNDAEYFMDMNIINLPIFTTHKRYGTWNGSPELYKEYAFHARNIEDPHNHNKGAYDNFLDRIYPEGLPELFKKEKEEWGKVGMGV